MEKLGAYITDMLGVKSIKARKNGSSIDFDVDDGVYSAELVGSAY